MHRLGLLLIFLVLSIGLVAFFVSTDSSVEPQAVLPVVAPSQKIPTITFIDPQLGATTASTTIIEFGDFTCPFCRDADIILRNLAAQHPDAVRLVWKDFPNDGHNTNATLAAYAGRCAQKLGKFELFRDWAFANQSTLKKETIIVYLQSLGLANAQECLADDSIKAKVNYTVSEGHNLGINGTPYILINNQTYNGPITLEALENIIK